MYRIWKGKRSSHIFALIMAVVTAAVVFLTVRNEGPDPVPMAVSLVFGLGAVFLILIRRPSGVAAVILNLAHILIIPAVAFMMLQYFTLDPLRIYPQMIAVNLLFSYLLHFFLSLLCGSYAIGYPIATFLLLFIGFANYFVVSFRSSPIVPWDLYSLRTAFSVAGNYSYTLDWRFAVAFLVLCFLMAAGNQITWKIRNILVRVLLSVLLLGMLAAGCIVLQRDDVQKALDMDTILFTPNVRYRNNGFLAAFIGDIHLIQVKEPDGYSPEHAEEILSKLGVLKESEEAETTPRPNIVILMNEAFSDLSVLGDFQVSEDYMPFMRKMMKEYNGCQLMVSVKGGNTANTEYEFLAGDTTAFLPEGSVVYQQFIHDNVPALPSYLAGLGYTTTAIHPYNASGWERDKVYDMLGFRSFLSLPDFSDPQLLRGFVSDQSAFDKVKEVFENRTKEEPQFVFEVTMQNHGGYSKDTSDFHETIYLKGLSKSTTQTRAAEKYLTLIKKSDEALKDLIHYFEELDEPTIVVMFGDHQPSDYITGVISRLTGYDADASLKEAQKSYIVPCLIWNNFGMEMEKRPVMSVNYLAADLLEAAGLPLSPYQKYLLKMQEKLPVIAAGAFMDANGNYFSWEEEKTGAYRNILGDYRILQYNHLNDPQNRVYELFTRQNR